MGISLSPLKVFRSDDMDGDMAWVSAVIVMVCAATGALGWARHRWTVVTVRGTSMSPTMEDGDRVLVRRCAGGDLQPGQIVVASPPGRGLASPPGRGLASPPGRGLASPPGGGCSRWNIKRAVALPGDPVPADVRPVVRGEVVPPGALVVRGDHPLSLDSRQLGFYSLDAVMGIVTYQMSTGRRRG
jgi:signal peptidase I